MKDFSDGSIYLSVKYAGGASSDYTGAGIIFREQDHKNFYAATLTSSGIILYKLSGNSKTILDKEANPIRGGAYTDLKVTAKGDHIKVYVNGVPLIDLHDSTFDHGLQGIFAEAPNVYLKNYHIEQSPRNTTGIDGISIVGTPIHSNVDYKDPENDPAIESLAKWTYTNTAPEKFLDAGDGHSDTNATNSYVNRTVVSPFAQLDKVGVYKVNFTEPDDPAPPVYRYPDPMYAGFRQYADPSTKTMIVHRAPVNKFTITQNADNTLTWNEGGYDPDRWLGPSYYSTEKQEFQWNRGIYQRLYGYTDPDGNVTSGKLTRPTKQGTYTLREAVADEYGAWSDWYEQQVYVSVAVPDNPPAVTLAFPAGTQSSPDYVNGLTPTIVWSQTDPDVGTVFAQARIIVKDEAGNVAADRTIDQNTAAMTGQWQIDAALAIGVKYQVQVMVSDDGGKWSGWSNIGWLITNRPPNATMTYPDGTYAAPTIVGTLRPTFVWSQTDPDSGTTLTYFQLQVWDETNTVLLLDSGQRWQGSTAASGSWTADADLPVRQKLRVRVRVYDGFAWSDWSPDAWLLINRTPLADFDWSPKPVWEGDSPRLMNASSDPDGDSLAYVWQVTGPNGAVASYSTKDVTLASPAAAGTYTVTLTVSDGIASASVTKAIPAQPLTIDAEVTYTPQWLAYHEQHGHQTTAVPKDFYSGEIFVVRAISSPTTVTDVSAWIDTTAADGSALACSTILTASGTSYHFAGELYDDAFSSLSAGLPVGPLPIHFRIRYANGVVKVQDVPVNILGPVLRTVGVHRVQ